MKIVANHYVVANADPYYHLKPNAGSDKIWVWMAQDFAEGELAVEQFALKFGSPEKAKAFEAAFEDAKVRNLKAMAPAASDSPKSAKAVEEKSADKSE